MKPIVERYNQEIVPQLIKENRFHIMNVPKITKIVVSMGLGQAINDKHLLDIAEQILSVITGQKPIRTKAKNSLAGFKLREGMEIGLKVTLRGSRKYDFLDKLICVVLPRIKDFEGMSVKSFDNKGNYSFGIKEHTVFPEINYDQVDRILGMNICIVTTAMNNKDAFNLLHLLKFPFRKQGEI